MKPRAALVLLGVTVLWGSTFIVTKSIVREAPPLVYLTFRFTVASLVMLAWLGPRVPRTRAVLVDGALIGLLNSAGLMLQVFGQVYTTASKSAFITSLNTPLTPIVGFFLYKMRPTRPQLAAVLLATFGLFLLTYPEADARWNRGDLITFGCAAIFGFTIVEMARRTPRHDPLALTCVQLVSAAIFFGALAALSRIVIGHSTGKLPEMLMLEARPLVPTSQLILEGLYMAVVCSVVTFAAQTWAMARLSATHAAIIFALEPVFATLMAIGVDGSAEWPGARGAVGAVLVMCAVVISELRLQRRQKVE